MAKKLKLAAKRYLVIGSNNFWYGEETSLAEAKREASHILNGGWRRYEAEEPERVYVYRANEVL